MTVSNHSATQSGFRSKWLLYLGAAVALLATARYFHVQDLLSQALLAKAPWNVGSPGRADLVK